MLLFCWLVGWLVGWLIGCSLLVSWLVGWLVDWLFCVLSFACGACVYCLFWHQTAIAFATVALWYLYGEAERENKLFTCARAQRMGAIRQVTHVG